MRRMREHVHRLHLDDAIAVIDQIAHVARLRVGIAGDVHDAPGASVQAALRKSGVEPARGGSIISTSSDAP